jgi:hypothetical protein
MRISERYAIVTLIEAKDYGSVGIQSDAVFMGKLQNIGCLFTFGALTGNSILLAYASAARDLETTAIAFNYRLAAATYKSTAADQLGDVIAVTAAGLTLTAATFQHKQLLIEFDSDSGADGAPWLTFNIDATATMMNVAAFGVGEQRNAQHLSLSVL